MNQTPLISCLRISFLDLTTCRHLTISNEGRLAARRTSAATHAAAAVALESTKFSISIGVTDSYQLPVCGLHYLAIRKVADSVRNVRYLALSPNNVSVNKPQSISCFF
jgi:hypothetical protein